MTWQRGTIIPVFVVGMELELYSHLDHTVGISISVSLNDHWCHIDGCDGKGCCFIVPQLIFLNDMSGLFLRFLWLGFSLQLWFSGVSCIGVENYWTFQDTLQLPSSESI
jgi:hypothetical protein